MYDPSIGRWISEDPVGFEAGDENLYRYVGNNPTNVTDPSGLVGGWGSAGTTINGIPFNPVSGRPLHTYTHPPAPSVHDQFKPRFFYGGTVPDRDLIAWFDKNAGGHVNHAKKNAAEAIDARIRQEYNNKECPFPPTTIGITGNVHSVRPDYDDANTPSGALFDKPKDYGETRFGDRRQTPLVSVR